MSISGKPTIIPIPNCSLEWSHVFKPAISVAKVLSLLSDGKGFGLEEVGGWSMMKEYWYIFPCQDGICLRSMPTGTVVPFSICTCPCRWLTIDTIDLIVLAKMFLQIAAAFLMLSQQMLCTEGMLHWQTFKLGDGVKQGGCFAWMELRILDVEAACLQAHKKYSITLLTLCLINVEKTLATWEVNHSQQNSDLLWHAGGCCDWLTHWRQAGRCTRFLLITSGCSGESVSSPQTIYDTEMF